MSTMEDKSPKTKSKKRKIVSDYRSSSTSSSEDSVCHKKKHSKCKEKKYKKTRQQKSVENKKLETSLQQNDKYSDKKLPEKIKKEHKECINQEKDEDKQIELDVWYYLLHHLEESEKLIALKLLVGINKMKKNWKENSKKNKYVDKKVVDDMKLVIKTLQDEQEKNKAEKQQLMQEKNELQKKVLEERKFRIQLAETLANEIEKNHSQSKKQTKEEVPNNIEELNKAEDEQVNQTITDIFSKKQPSTSTTSSNDGNNNRQVYKVKGDMKKEVDLRYILNNRESGGMREPHMNLIPSPLIRNFPAFTPHHCAKRISPNFIERLCVNIKTSIRYFPEVIRIIETTLRMPIRFNKVISFNGGWKVEFPSPNAKINFLNQKNHFKGTGLFVTNSYRIN